MASGQAQPLSVETRLLVDISMPDPRWADIDDVTAAAERAVRATTSQGGLETAEAEISLVLADDGLVQRLNRDFRGKDRPTNVLSFALTEGDPAPSAGTLMLGDVVLAFETVAREAREQSKALQDHMLHLVIHGVLHLMGYDHESVAEARTMERMETQILATLGIADPYLEGPPPA